MVVRPPSNKNSVKLWKRRDRLSILISILRATMEARGKTDIMSKANLSFAQVTKYLEDLSDTDFNLGNFLGDDESNSIEDNRRRDRYFIIYDILRNAKDGILKTQLMFNARLSFDQITNYLGLLVKKLELLQYITKNGENLYQATQAGLDFVNSYERLKWLSSMNSNEGLIKENGEKYKITRRGLNVYGHSLNLKKLLTHGYIPSDRTGNSLNYVAALYNSQKNQ